MHLDVGGRIAEFTTILEAFYNDALQKVGVVQEVVGDCHITLAEGLADGSGGDITVCVALLATEHTNAEFLSVVHIVLERGFSVSKMIVVADNEDIDPKTFLEDFLHEIVCRHLGKLWGEFQHFYPIHSCSTEQLELFIGKGQKLGGEILA